MVRLSDGHIQTLDTEIFTMVLHFGNAWQPDHKTIVIEGTAFENRDNNPFNILNRNNLETKEGIISENGCVFKRFTLDLEAGSVRMDDLIRLKYG